MDQIAIVAVDERDSGWEDPGPRFRVYLQGGITYDGVAWTGGTTSTYDVTGADLLQVIDWAQRQASDDATYSIALVVEDPGRGRGLVWLVGLDGNDTPDDPVTVEAQRRMLARRHDPVVVGQADRMPAQGRFETGLRPSSTTDPEHGG